MTESQAIQYAAERAYQEQARMAIWKDTNSPKHVVRDDRISAPWGFCFVGTVSREGHFSSKETTNET